MVSPNLKKSTRKGRPMPVFIAAAACVAFISFQSMLDVDYVENQSYSEALKDEEPTPEFSQSDRALLASVEGGKSPWPAISKWDKPVSALKCRKTNFFPISSGCPGTCDRIRILPTNEPLYKTSVYWDFGSLDEDVKRKLANTTDVSDAKRVLGELFPRAKTEFVEKILQYEHKVHQVVPPDLVLEKASKIRLDLFYFCCLTASEIDQVRSILSTWMTNRKFQVPIRFERSECWQERASSITGVLVPDSGSQGRIFRDVYTDGVNQLKKAGIPLVVTREQQVPFHVFIAEMHTPDDLKSITPYVIQVAGVTNSLVSGSKANSETSLIFDLTFAPTLSVEMTCEHNCPK